METKIKNEKIILKRKRKKSSLIASLNGMELGKTHFTISS